MNKVIRRITRSHFIYVIEKKWWHPIYTPIEGLYIARIYKRVGLFKFAPTSVRFSRKQGEKVCTEELEHLLRKYEQTTK